MGGTRWRHCEECSLDKFIAMLAARQVQQFFGCHEVRRSAHKPIGEALCQIGNRQSKIKMVWWRRRELNSDPKTNAEGIYMLSRFSCLSRRIETKIRSVPSQ